MPSSVNDTDHLRLLLPRRRTRRFVAIAIITTLLINALGTLLGLFTAVLNGHAFGFVTWAYVQGIGQFAVAVFVGHLYVYIANRGDEQDEKEAPS